MGSKYIKNDNIVFREEGEGAFLFDSANGNLKYLNRSAKEIYLMLDKYGDFDHLADRVAGIYPDSDPEEIEKDLNTFFNDMVDNGFLTAIDGETD